MVMSTLCYGRGCMYSTVQDSTHSKTARILRKTTLPSTTTDRTHQTTSQPPIKILYSTLHYYKLLIQHVTAKVPPIASKQHHVMSCLSLAIIRPLIRPKSSLVLVTRRRRRSRPPIARGRLLSRPVVNGTTGLDYLLRTRHMLLTLCVYGVYGVYGVSGV